MSDISRGFSYPLGATLTEDGTNFAIFSEYATAIDLELHNGTSRSAPSEVIPIKEVDDRVWHVEVHGVRPGQRYAFRVDGKYDPRSGMRFNKNKLLIDPYSKAIDGIVQWDDSIFPYQLGSAQKDLAFDKRDDSQFIPRGMVIDPSFDWKGIGKPTHPWDKTIIYETHVKGFTHLRMDIPEEERGTYAGLASSQMIDYLKDLGVTAVELLPVHHHIDDRILADAGLSNYWGYNTIGYFAPDIRYSSKKNGEQVQEFKRMVRTLHEQDIEVILDVVYNHTGEGNNLGPSLSFRGIDNLNYYMLDPRDLSKYLDFTGTGNSLDASKFQVLQLIMDSLRYWAQDMQVDGFRFDLASTLARELYNVNMLSPFLEVIHQDPVVRQTKLIAEPWDIGPGGYQVGNFPSNWAEWNGVYRDAIRKFWRREQGLIGQFATRISGSPDIYQHGRRKPISSINFVTSHDGFTLMDLVSYNRQHNEANGPLFAQGAVDNLSSNLGVEGVTDDPGIRGRRVKRIKNFIVTLFVSQGVPMILGGDEMGRTQNGNNNSFCQDNAISWYSWDLDSERRELYKFTKHMIALRKSNHVLRRSDFFTAASKSQSTEKEISWFTPEGTELTQEQWNNPNRMTLMVWLSGQYNAEPSYKGETEDEGDLLLLFNASTSPRSFRLPRCDKGWELYLDTSLSTVDGMPMSIICPNYLLNRGACAIIREKET